MAGVSNSSVIKCRVSDGIKPNTWSAGVSNFCNNLVLVQLVTPPNTIIGRATLTIDTVRLQPDSASITSFVSMSVADEYDIITGGLDVKEQQVRPVSSTSLSLSRQQNRGKVGTEKVLVVQRFGVGLVIERSLVRLPAGALSSQLDKLGLPSVPGR